MASRVFDQLWGIGKNRTLLHGRFMPNGTSPLTGVQGAGFTVARTAVGMYTVTLADRWPALLYCDVQLVLTTPTNQTGKIMSYNPATTPGAKSTVVFSAWDPTLNSGAGGAFDPAFNAGNYVLIQMVFNNTTIALGG